MDRWKSVYARKTDKRTLGEVIDGADIFLGLSAGGVLKPDMVKRMAERPLIMALANPNPEITPEEALAARPDAMICTGRSDYPNQVNNVLCFPYIFRGALDVGATAINEEMKRAAVEAIAALAREAPSDVAARAYGGEMQHLWPGLAHPQSVRPAADPADRAGSCQGSDGVRRRHPADRRFRRLSRPAQRVRVPLRLHHEAGVHPGQSRAEARRLCRGRGRARPARHPGRGRGGLAHPLLIGRPAVVEARLERFGLSIRPGRDFTLINPDDDPRYRNYVQAYVEIAGRKGITPDAARTICAPTQPSSRRLMVQRGDADALLVRGRGPFHEPSAPYPRHHRSTRRA